MKVYVLTADVWVSGYGSEIFLFGVFTTEEKAQKQADEMKLGYYDINSVDIDETKVSTYLGGYIE